MAEEPFYRSFFLFYSVPAVRTKLAGLKADGSDHVVQTMEAQGGEIHFLTDAFQHFLIILAVRIGVVRQYFLGDVFTFSLADDAPGDQIIIGGGAAEIDILAAVYQRRTCRAHMDFPCTALVQEFRRVL